ncbi:hypothetical protein CVU83_01330 [Candidatus Falkowbacteria bacterium HGW-Falkowbacteria-2]|uniref:Uncharacterized protein n=1 Tax=Candidatus Falkowbacteria bacterium HGW-Falkowbacteria-2 TaxID=2013769 RepID=A0A2N2E1M9_9BACT|nr:MAG: hypothetical protein CVU83_01330 [Candidatus Falkowbacteria bacterium HGW-Falkowbacteria-2]
MSQSIYNITIREFNKLAKENKPFSAGMVREETIRHGGISRVAPCVTIKDYFQEKLEKGFLTHVGEGMYLPTKKMQLALSTSPALIEHGFDVETVDLLDDFKMLLDSDSMDEFEIRKIISNREKREAGVL